jgi:FdhD protein
MDHEDRVYSMLTAKSVHRVRILHVTQAEVSNRADFAATEEPMEVRLNGEPFAVIMRTPGADRELAAGFLLAERVISGVAEIESMERHPQDRNVLDVCITGSVAERLEAIHNERRRVVTNSSCGLCGRVTIESLQLHGPQIRADWTIPAALVPELPAVLRRAQAVFDATGGLHAAGLFDREGRLDLVAEDVGRHNAVDKVIGRMLLDGRLPLNDSILFVSGRTSFEIVQKAFLAGIPIVGAVSAPSSLAVELASDVGITLLGFVRSATFNVYATPERIIVEQTLPDCTAQGPVTS